MWTLEISHVGCNSMVLKELQEEKKNGGGMMLCNREGVMSRKGAALRVVKCIWKKEPCLRGNAGYTEIVFGGENHACTHCGMEGRRLTETRIDKMHAGEDSSSEEQLRMGKSSHRREPNECRKQGMNQL
eukprot:Gb_28809 [translate_table: standard]